MRIFATLSMLAIVSAAMFLAEPVPSPFPREPEQRRATTHTITPEQITVRTLDRVENISGNGNGWRNLAGMRFRLSTETDGNWMFRFCAGGQADAGSAMWVGVELDGDAVAPERYPFVAGSTGLWGGYCATWVAPDVPAGKHQVIVRASADTPAGAITQIGARTLTIWHPR